ncbi:MAG TPA: exodeoxyribonuclease VII small subunit [Coriobacteriia bacterium]|nr:exodeoxyribonuclease VII small subunit [Coriobacteriia bacterium]
MSEELRTPASELPFGSALAELETIVSGLESGTLELEDSLDRYERGVALLRSLQARLGEAQQKVTMLLGELESETDDDTVEGAETR